MEGPFCHWCTLCTPRESPHPWEGCRVPHVMLQINFQPVLAGDDCAVILESHRVQLWGSACLYQADDWVALRQSRLWGTACLWKCTGSSNNGATIMRQQQEEQCWSQLGHWG